MLQKNPDITYANDRVNVTGVLTLWLADAARRISNCTIPALFHRESLPKPLILVSLDGNGYMRATPC